MRQGGGAPSKCRPTHLSPSTVVARQSASREYAILGEYVRALCSRCRATVTWVLTCLTRCGGAFAALPHRPPCLLSIALLLWTPLARCSRCRPTCLPPSPTFAVVACVRCCAVMFLVPPSSRRHNFEPRPVSVAAIGEPRQRQYV